MKSEKFEIQALLSDKKDAAALQFAKDNELPAHFAKGESELLGLLEYYNPDLICLAGFMKVLSADFINAWRGKIINIHPSLLPEYKGLNTHSRVLKAGERMHGATVHYVTEALDSGEIILQSPIDIHDDDTPDSLANRLLPCEHKLYIDVVTKLANEKLIQELEHEAAIIKDHFDYNQQKDETISIFDTLRDTITAVINFHTSDELSPSHLAEFCELKDYYSEAERNLLLTQPPLQNHNKPYATGMKKLASGA